MAALLVASEVAAAGEADVAEDEACLTLIFIIVVTCL